MTLEQDRTLNEANGSSSTSRQTAQRKSRSAGRQWSVRSDVAVAPCHPPCAPALPVSPCTDDRHGCFCCWRIRRREEWRSTNRKQAAQTERKKSALPAASRSVHTQRQKLVQHEKGTSGSQSWHMCFARTNWISRGLRFGPNLWISFVPFSG